MRSPRCARCGLTDRTLADAYLQTQFDILTEVIAKLRSGVRSYSIGNRTVTYEDLPKLLREQRDVAAQISAGDSGPLGTIDVYPERRR